MKIKRYCLIILTFIIAASCCTVVVFAKINDDVVDMDDLNKITTAPSSEDRTVAAGSRGDTNGDGRLDIRDVVVLKKHLAGYTNLKIVKKACDVNGDGITDIRDAVLLNKVMAGVDIDLNETTENTASTDNAQKESTPSVTPTKDTTSANITTSTPPAISTPPITSTPPTAASTPSNSEISQASTVEPASSTTHPDPDGPGWSDWITLD